MIELNQNDWRIIDLFLDLAKKSADEIEKSLVLSLQNKEFNAKIFYHDVNPVKKLIREKIDTLGIKATEENLDRLISFIILLMIHKR